MLSRIYSNIFIAGDCTVFAKHLYSAIVGNIRSDSKPEVNFEDFIVSLSTIMRGSQEERIKWLFNFYDIQKDGRISRDVIKYEDPTITKKYTASHLNHYFATFSYV